MIKKAQPTMGKQVQPAVVKPAEPAFVQRSQSAIVKQPPPQVSKPVQPSILKTSPVLQSALKKNTTPLPKSKIAIEEEWWETIWFY